MDGLTGKHLAEQNNQDKVRAALAKIWQTSRPEALSRLLTLENFVVESRSGGSDGKFLANALSAAHRLSGSLGMFGLDEASAYASEIESLLCQKSGFDLERMTELLRQLRTQLEK